MTRPDEALMDRGGMASSALRVVMKPTNLFALALAFLFTAAVPGTAQTVVGGVQPPSVTVDQSVLDSLGPPRTLPDLLRGAPPERGVTAPTYRRERTAEHQAKTKKKKVVAKAKPKHHPPAVAAHRAAPVAPVAATAPAVPRESVAATPLPEPRAAPSPPAATAAAEPNATTAAAPSDTAPAAPPSDTAAAAPSATAAIPPAAPAETATAAASPSPQSAPAPPPPSAARAAPAPAKPATPTVALPSPVPSASPSPEAKTAMAAPPSLPPAPKVAATPVTPIAAPAAVAAAAPAGATRVLFGAGAADLPDSAKPELDALVQRLSSNDEVRLQLVAHASGSDDQANEARRISLQRALAVRSYLIEHGIASTRMDVRALGNRGDGAAGDPLDRVDVIMLEH